MSKLPIIEVDNDKIVSHSGDIIWVMWDTMTVDEARGLISEIMTNGDLYSSRVIIRLGTFIEENE